MLIRKNTKAFKTILEIIDACQDRPDREKLIRLFITQPGHSVHDRISVEGIQGNAGLFYAMNYQTVLNSLRSSAHQLHISDEINGIYFFHSTSNKVWQETPFEFDEAIAREFASLPELPVVRKREKPKPFVLPTADKTAKAVQDKKKPEVSKKSSKKSERVANAPAYRLGHAIQFTALDRIIFKHPRLIKKDVLDYYSQIAEHLLPSLKGRHLCLRLHADSGPGRMVTTAEALFENAPDRKPDWFQTGIAKTKGEPHALLCVDKEHLMFFVEMGGLEFHPLHARIKSSGSPDYIVIAIDGPESEPAKVIDTLLKLKEILTGLRLPSLLKTDGASGFHVYIPLDARSDFKTGNQAAAYICKLVRLKLPDLVALKEPDRFGYGKVSLDYSFNETGKGVVAPYSLVGGDSVAIATPLLWTEVNTGTRWDEFNPEEICKRIKRNGDPFKTMLSKKVNAETLLERLEENYAFLL